MASELFPEDVLHLLEKGQLAPFYLFYGPSEFRLEKVLDRIRECFIPESARDFNLEILYGGEIAPAEIINRAQSIPFMANNRLIIVRRTEQFKPKELEAFLPYLEDPSETTCLIFVSTKTDFKRKFYKKIKSKGQAVQFKALRDSEVVPWIKRMSREMDLNMDGQAAAYLQQVAGNSLMELHGELEKIHLRYGEGTVGIEQVRDLVIHSRVYTIFELMNAFSVKDCARSLGVLNRFLEEEDKRGAPLRIVGMLNRQLRLLWQAKDIMDHGGRSKDVAKKLALMPFSAKNLTAQAKHWSADELEKGLAILYGVDGLLKSGSRPKPVLEDLVVSLCD